MKNLFKNLMLVAVAAMAFTACQNDNNEVNNVAKESTIEFTAGFDASRSQFGEMTEGAYPSFWNGGEQVFAEVVDANNSTSVSTYMEKVDEAGASANFKVTFVGDYTDGTISFYTPYSNSSATSGWWNEWVDGGYQMVPQIPTTQTPNANSVEAAAHILKAEHAFAGALTSGSANLTFEHAVAYGKMTLNLGEVVAFENIASVRVVFGEQAYTLLRDNLTEPTFWFACKEAVVETMTITITDDEGATYVREITTSVEKPLAFVTGQVSKFAVGGFEEVELEQVTDISASYDSWNSKYSFTIDHVNGARIWLTLYAEADGGLLPEGEFEYFASCGYMYADYANLADYRDLEEYYIEVAHLDEGYEIIFWFADETGEEWEFTYSGVVRGICNPPVPEAVVVEGEAEDVSATASGWGDENYFTLNFTAGNYRVENLWFATEANNEIIPEGDHDASEATVYYLDAEGNETGWSYAIEGTVTVAHAEENYSIEFVLEDANGSTFNFTYEGAIEGLLAPNTEFSTRETPTNVAATAEGKVVTVTWDAIEGISYEVTVGYDSRTFETSPAEFTVSNWDTTYDVSVVAKGNDADIFDSEAATTTVTVGPAPELPLTEVVFTSVVAVDGDATMGNYGCQAIHLTFTDATGTNTLKLFVQDSDDRLEGDYVIDYGYEHGYALPFNCDFNGVMPMGGTITFAHDGENYTVTMNGITDKSDWSDGTFRMNGTYEGTIEFNGVNMGAGSDEPQGPSAADFIRAEAELDDNNSNYQIWLYDSEDNCLYLHRYYSPSIYDYAVEGTYNGETIVVTNFQKPNIYEGKLVVNATVTLPDGSEIVFNAARIAMDAEEEEETTVNYTLTKAYLDAGYAQYGDIHFDDADGTLVYLSIPDLANNIVSGTWTKSDIDLNNSWVRGMENGATFANQTDINSVDVSITAVDGSVTAATITIVKGSTTHIFTL